MNMRNCDIQEFNNTTSIKCIKACSEICLTIKRSQFYGYAIPLNKLDDVGALLDEYKARQPLARHHAYAWRYIDLTGDLQQYERFSDAGEPSKTAGPPIYNVLSRNQINNTLIIVSRIFGGVLLGTGGLVHAYGSAAQMAIDETKIVDLVKHQVLEFVVTYALWPRVEAYLKTQNIKVIEQDYLEAIVVKIAVQVDLIEPVLSVLNELSSGSCQVKQLGERYLPI